MRRGIAVGYSGNELRKGAIGVVPQFVGVAEADGSVDLQTIKCNDECSDAVTFKILNNIGISDIIYLWINWYDPGDGNRESCWVEETYEKVVGMNIQPGQGMWVFGSADPVDPENLDPEVDQLITFPGVELK